jgi:fluoride exporter
VSSLPNRSLQGDLHDLALVAGGAIPGALLRWQLEAEVFANMLGCLLLGVVLAQSRHHKRLMLWAGIGFCGALTTFCTWMLDLARALQTGKPGESALLLLASLAGGVALVALGHTIGMFLSPRLRDWAAMPKNQ